MKLNLNILQRFIDLQENNAEKIRLLLDDVGLEVKGIEQIGNQTIFNIETLANRGDHLYALGIARELAARLLTTVNMPQVSATLSDRKPSLPVRNSTDKCLSYGLLEMQLPRQLKLRPDITATINLGEDSKKPPIVDLLNYLQAEIGQPMHAFDKAKVDGEISIVLSDKPEKILALDGKEYQVPVGSILIRDRVKTIAVGGVIGCANTMVSDASERVLIEAAVFDSVCVRKTARAMGISTDASYFFERGVDRDNVLFAFKRIVHLAQASALGSAEKEGAHVLGLEYLQTVPLEKRQVQVRLAEVRHQLNSPRLDEQELVSRLRQLGYIIQASGEKAERSLMLQVPSWRLWDVFNEEDIIEDIARARSLASIKQSLPPLDYQPALEDPLEVLLLKLEPALIGSGYQEVISKGFYAAEDVKLLSELDPQLGSQQMALKNSLESAYSHMKITNLLHLYRLAEQHTRRFQQSFKVYELCRIFQREKVSGRRFEYEKDILSLATSGRWFEHEFRKPEDLESQLLLMKGVLEKLIRACGKSFKVKQSKHKLLHPGYQADVYAGAKLVGHFGLVHPHIRESLDFKSLLVYAEIEAEQLCQLVESKRYQSASDYPPIRRDLTLKLPEKEFAIKVCDAIEKLGFENLHQVIIADTFKKPDENFSRLTIRITFQSNNRTLEHSEVDVLMAQIVAHLKSDQGLEIA